MSRDLQVAGGWRDQAAVAAGNRFGAGSALPKLHLWQLAHNRQNKGSSRSGAEEQTLGKDQKALHVCMANVLKGVQCVV